MAVLTAAVSVMLIDGTVVAVLLPVIIGDLEMTLTQAEWANAAFTLAFAALLPAGWLGIGSGSTASWWRALVFLVGVVLAGAVTTGTARVNASPAGVPGLPDEAVNPLADAIAESGGTAIITIRDADAVRWRSGR